ncbi:YihY family inner membrane protein [Kangiella sp. TOML190]|uniref:YihY family inner membrane protein n=1 Tax=Kangiella sp. TOML190 TaxID=2931351 RepID=UPI00203CFC52|nr:YihY family inner membrane protein [Kangiella sp. TOML190]
MEKRWNWLKAFTKFVFSQFAKKNVSALASELTLNNMLALVPLMTVAVSLLAIFPAFESTNTQIQELIFKNLLPEKGLVVQEYLNDYVSKSKNLSAIGFIFLFITALMLIRSIDSSINAIWESNNRRQGIYKWLAYWAMLTMAPILVAASLLATSSFAALPVFDKISGILSLGLPFALIVFAFTALYMITPNSRVEFKKALIAAVFTALLFEVAKYGFAIFITKFSTYEVIYGAITAIPLFFLWVFLSWLILLFGAVICYALHRFDPSHKKKKNPFISALKIAQFFAVAQSAESTVTIRQLKQQFSDIHEQILLNQVDELVELGFLAKLENEAYCLAVNGKELTIADLYRKGSWRLPNSQDTVEEQDFLVQKIEQANLHLDRELMIPILKPQD